MKTKNGMNGITVPKMICWAACIGLISSLGIYAPRQVGLYSFFVASWVCIGILIKYYNRMEE